MKTTHARCSDLHFDPKNTRKHDKRNIIAIKASLSRFGQQKPIVVDCNNVVVAGNGTLAAAIELGWDEIQIHKTELEGNEAIAYAIADNRTGELATWDEDALAQTLASLQNDESVDELATGFTAKAVEDLIGKPEVVEDEVPEPPKEPVTQPGDLWLFGAYWECDDCGKRYDYDEGKTMEECPCG